ncbi:hypothetical protein NKH80_28175 [Mesorhizobium sp. M0904]|uniref:hypothetical protein n=1 Tax=unclassified Mesorhizobium TaxID=325217 RepID=UPI00333CB7C1
MHKQAGLFGAANRPPLLLGAAWYSFRIVLLGPMVEHDAHGPTNGRHDDKLDQIVVTVAAGRGRPANDVQHRPRRYGVAGTEP